MKEKSDAKGSIRTGADKDLVQKAVAALIKHHENEVGKSGKNLLLGSDCPINVQIGLERVPQNPSFKPIRVLIPHPLWKLSEEKNEGTEEPDVCLIVKTEAKPDIKETIEDHAEYMGCIKKVLTLDSLRTKYGRFQQRRELLAKYDVFMADDRILPMLTKALGKNFVRAKKLPIPICLTRKEALPFAIRNAMSATFLTLSGGTCVGIRAGNTGMPLENIVENIMAICENAVPKLPRKWANVRNIMIKTPDSVALPIYNKTPDELREIAILAGIPVTKLEDREVKKDKETKESGEESKKRDLGKSPLVRALKKQKTKERDGKKANEGSKKNVKEKKDETDKAEIVDEANDPPKGGERDTENQGKKDEVKSRKRADSEESPKKSRKRADSEGSAKEKSRKHPISEEDGQKSKKKKKTREKSLSKGKTAEASSAGGVEEAKGTSSKKQEKVKMSESIKKAADENDKKEEPLSEKTETREFIPSRKFKGSREGYFFRAGKEGVGYYIDIKPVVNKAALAAIARSASHSGRRKSGGKRSKSQRRNRR